MLGLVAPEPYILWLTGAGLLIALVAWLPLALKRLPLSLPMICIAIGAGIFSLTDVALRPMPRVYPQVAERLTEFVVIIALMGAGLKLDRPFAWRRWGVTWRLLIIAMPLSIGAITLLGGVALGLAWTTALLLGASLAPTDPVLAADVQVGPPRTGEEDEVRFGLTSEAGFNDGFAFPFVNLAIALGLSAASGKPWLQEWVLHSVLWEVAAGVGLGWLIGRLFGWLTFKVPAETKLARTGDGLIAISATFVSYGVTEILNCYGFLAVFVTALALRRSHRDHDFNYKMHAITEQVERLAMMVVLILFGGAIVGGLLRPLRWEDWLAAAAIILVVRPIAGMVALKGLQASLREKLMLAFFGIRGVGSFYYLAYAINHSEVVEASRLWAIVGLVCLLSILLHGLTVTPLMRSLDRSHGRDPDELDAPPPGLQGPGRNQAQS
ncbi:cation:proton antiporter [Novosphingobium sp. JCM 18896]|uniref:cation:proton antiporter n=1 Tax=Novosphingobium sp. JCM 18896 TaxID=2989731 RepID=UPI002223E422|nr:cation:proton antiporter [Novosphingobium sp. JCM 18896]MCW1432196.1 cation:proton antiporter [Novosphingobium sp. JCM 18896]